jgi:hypothetical protein
MLDRCPTIAAFSLCLSSTWWTPLRAETAEKVDPASLSGLHDIVVLAPVAPWWPLAPGWYLLAGLLVVWVVWVLWYRRKRRLAKRYRVEAVAQLRALRRERADPDKQAAQILVLLKRTALGAYPRIDVAALQGAAWWRFLDLSGGKPRFADGLGAFAEQLAYARQGDQTTAARDLKRLYRAAEQWIKRHRSADHASVVNALANSAPAGED